LEGFKIEVVLWKLQSTQKMGNGLAVDMRFARKQRRTLDGLPVIQSIVRRQIGNFQDAVTNQRKRLFQSCPVSNTLFRFAGDNEPFTVKLVFDKTVADSVLEREWHPNQKTKVQKSGNVELEFTAKGDVEVKRWIMAWGRYCTVKSPKWIKQMIDDEVDAMVAGRQ